MSNRIRQIRETATRPRFEDLPPHVQEYVSWLAQMNEENQDYLHGPSMASVMLKQAKGDYLKDQMQQADEMGMGTQASPMIASILQLDRQ